MSIKSRLVKAEQRIRDKQPCSLFVHIEGQPFGYCDGVQMTVAEWEAQHPNEKKIDVTGEGVDYGDPRKFDETSQ